MNVVLLTLLQGVGSVTLSVVAFSVALTWPALTASIEGMRTERSRLLTYGGLGVALLIAAVPIYLAPGLLLRDELGFALSIPLVATWVIAAAALVVRGLLLTGIARVISYSYAIVACAGLLAGIVSGLYAQHRIADTITPTGGFLLALAAVTGIVLWSNTDSPTTQRA
ncbi:hypothetical protein [Leifsonia sp. NPDC058248]|uniref:hypothetical protein n=1 Tax=Leifsonia sp. NPDC058248 TaxID=3346402 RepID=UPI0036DD04CE